MDVQAIETLLQDSLPGCILDLVADGNKIGLKVISEAFDGLNRVKRQQRIYAILDDMIKSGEIHAVTMVTQTPEEAGE